MTTKSDSISTFDNEQFEDEEPITIRTSITKELYHGNKLKSRIELSGSREFPGKARINEEYSPINRRIPKKSNLKEYNIDMQQKGQGDSMCYWIISCVFILFSVFLVIYYSPREVVSLENIENELHTKVLNQDNTISSIISILQLFAESSKTSENVRLLKLLTGPTGVGKSHVINILKKRFRYKLNVFYSSDLKDFIEKKFLDSRFYINSNSIIVFDDLVSTDVDHLSRFMNLIKSSKLRFLVFAVFNTQNKGCLQNTSVPDMSITSEYLRIYDHDIVTFNDLDETTIRRWLKKALEEENINIKFHDEIINNLLTVHDIKCHGLKGLHSKLLLEMPKYR